GNDETRTVEVVPDAIVIIPGIEGPCRPDQLKHHLEIQRMSKSKGNVVNPDDWVTRHGSDSVRAYLMFGFDWQKGGPWDSKGIQGVVRWVNDVWDIVTGYQAPAQGDAEAERTLERKLHQTIKKVSDGLENFSFNTSIAGLMGFRNDLKDAMRAHNIGQSVWREVVGQMLRLMAPFTPHITEELWAQQGHGYSIHQQSWPVYDSAKAAEDTVTLVVQVNGKVRDRIDVPAGITEADAQSAALASENVQKLLNGGSPRKVIFVPARSGQEPKINVVI
ncbi:MAG: class I tRNA ligase family protein, partial [Anaerolineae bacterium]|nr:class I tRNA ligase family protein [Anaerolineae bacterium]